MTKQSIEINPSTRTKIKFIFPRTIRDWISPQNSLRERTKLDYFKRNLNYIPDQTGHRSRRYKPAHLSTTDRYPKRVLAVLALYYRYRYKYRYRYRYRDRFLDTRGKTIIGQATMQETTTLVSSTVGL